MIISLDDTTNENDDRPRITRELVFRNGYQHIDKDIELFLDEARMKAIQAQIDDLRRDLQATSLERDTLKQTFIIERRQLQHELDSTVEDKMEAQKRAMHHFKNTEEAAETLKLIKTEHAAIVEKLRSNVERLQQENDDAFKRSEETQLENLNIRRIKEETEDQLINQVTHLKNEVDILKSMREGYEERLNEAHEKVFELTNKLNEYEMNENQSLGGSESRLLAEITEQYKRQCELTKQREISNQILKEELCYYKNNYPDFEQILEEKLSLQRENAQAEQLKLAYRKLQEENERLRDEQKEWSQYIESNGAEDQLHTPRDIIYRLAQEKRAIQQSQLEVKELKEHLEQTEAKDIQLNTQIVEATTKINELEALVKKQQIEIETVTQEKQIIELHRDMLVSQVNSMSKFQEAATTHEETFPLTHRIEELESLLKNYQDQLAQTKSTLIRERATCKENTNHGERILELKRSPSNIEQQCRIEELERLRTENRDLLNQLKSYQYDDNVDVGEKRKRESNEELVSEPTLSSLPSVQLIKIPETTLENLHTQVEHLKNEVASRDKRIIRVGQVAKRKIDGFVEQIRNLVGYTFTFQQDQTVRITPAYINAGELTFIYSLDDHDKPKLRAIGNAKNNYMRILQGTYDTFVSQQNNIPAFLSSVTLELMNTEDMTGETAVYYDDAYDEIEENEEGELIEEDDYDEQEKRGYYDQGQYSYEEGEYYDDEEVDEEDDEMNDYGVNQQHHYDGSGAHDEPITIDDDDD